MNQNIAIAEAGPLAEITIGDIMLNAPLLEKIDHMAKIMASAKATIPKHLAGSEGDCWAVIMQAIQWRMNPFAVAQKTHFVNGAIGYEAQLVNAVIANSGMIDGAFHYEYRGEGQNIECRVGAVLRGDSAITWGEWLNINSVQTKNSPLWKSNPKQQLAYLQVKNWARLYAPGAILGVYTPDELSDRPIERDITPPRENRVENLKAKLADNVILEVDTDEDSVDDTLTYAMVADLLNNATSLKELNAAVPLLAEFTGTGDNSKFRKELGALYQTRMAQLNAAADEISR